MPLSLLSRSIRLVRIYLMRDSFFAYIPGLSHLEYHLNGLCIPGLEGRNLKVHQEMVRLMIPIRNRFDSGRSEITFILSFFLIPAILVYRVPGNIKLAPHRSNETREWKAYRYPCLYKGPESTGWIQTQMRCYGHLTVCTWKNTVIPSTKLCPLIHLAKG